MHGIRMTQYPRTVDSTLIGALVNAVPLAFIGWLFVGMSKRIDHMTARIDRLYELLAAERK